MDSRRLFVVGLLARSLFVGKRGQIDSRALARAIGLFARRRHGRGRYGRV